MILIFLLGKKIGRIFIQLEGYLNGIVVSLVFLKNIHKLYTIIHYLHILPQIWNFVFFLIIKCPIIFVIMYFDS